MKTSSKQSLIKNFIIKNRDYIFLFIVMLIISFLIPLSGDDLANYNPNMTIIASIKNAYNGYFTYESRIVSRFLINLLCYHKTIWCILNSFCIVIIYWSFIKLFNISEKLGKYLMALAILVIPCAMFAQVYVWVTGSITYLFPAAIILGYFAYMTKVIKKYSYQNVPILLLINLLTPMFIDHLGPALFIVNLIVLINDYLKNKKISLWPLLCLLTCSFSISIVLFAPGNSNRLNTTPEFMELSLFRKLLHNYKNFLDYIFAANPIISILILIPIYYMIIKKVKNNNFFKYLFLILLTIIPIYSFIYHIDLYNPFIDYTSSLDFYWKDSEIILNSRFIYIFWTFLCILFILSIFYICQKDKDKIVKYLEILFVALIPNMVMMLSPTWGFRTTYFTNIILLAIIYSLIIDILKIDNYSGKDVKYFVISLFYIFIIYLLGIYIIVNHFEHVRLNNIKKLYNNGQTNIIIKTCPIRYMWNYNAYQEFHNEAYISWLYYNNIIKDKDITISFESLESYSKVVRGW